MQAHTRSIWSKVNDRFIVKNRPDKFVSAVFVAGKGPRHVGALGRARLYHKQIASPNSFDSQKNDLNNPILLIIKSTSKQASCSLGSRLPPAIPPMALLTTPVSSTVAPLRIAFSGPTVRGNSVLLPAFSDGTGFVWNPSQPASSALWSGFFCDAGSALPATYLSLPVMNNLSSYIWAWPSTTNSTMTTVSMPTGTLTLSAMMNAIYTATQQTISVAQYMDIAGTSYSGTGSPTLANALTQFVAGSKTQSSLGLCNITQESATVLRIWCW